MGDALDEFTFDQAWDFWWTEKEQSICSDKSKACFREYRKPLSRFFGQPDEHGRLLKLKNIHIGNIIAYRKKRMEGRRSEINGKWYPSPGAKLINSEVNALAQLLDRAGLWSEIKRFYKPLKFVRAQSIGQRPTDEELIYLFECAQKKPRWRVAYLASVISVQTTAGPGEVLRMRIGDIKWADGVIHIPGTKTKDRAREVPMTEDCFMAVRELELIARAKGAELPEHFLFPHRGNRDHPGADPMHHMGSYKKAWEKLREYASKRFPRLANVRRYDLRHVAISTILENPAIDEATAHTLIGHGPFSRLMFDVYFHARKKRKLEAVSVLQGITKPKIVAAPKLPIKKETPPPTLPVPLEPQSDKKPSQQAAFAAIRPKEYIN